jgi:hypothetical protein
MDPVPDDFRVVISTFYRYDRHTRAVVEALHEDSQCSGDTALAAAAARFDQIIEEIRSSNGIHLTRDTEVPSQASFVVPSLGITIVPVVYGDHHSWNLAHLPVDAANVPVHRHHEGVEIHLGYGPMRGTTILGDTCAVIDEGYAMPIPPQTDHGYVNASSMPHHVPFIFGSIRQAGWGVFLDVEPRPVRVGELRSVKLEDPCMNGSIYLERAIEESASSTGSMHRVLIPAAATGRNGSGGLELSIARVDTDGLKLPIDDFRIVSVVRGEGTVAIEGCELTVRPHDHFGIPAGMRASLRATRPDPLIWLDARLVDTSAVPRP